MRLILLNGEYWNIDHIVRFRINEQWGGVDIDLSTGETAWVKNISFQSLFNILTNGS